MKISPLDNPKETLIYALNKIGASYDTECVLAAIKNQLFYKKKTEYINKGMTKEAKFLRKGINGDYVNYLNKNMLKIIYNRYGKVMQSLKYKIEDL